MMNRELSMEFVRVTEAAAIASARGVGRGDKNGIDQLAVDAMRKMFDTVNISGTVVIGEGEMDEAPMLYIGEHVGAGGPEVDIAVDPVEGTNLVAKGQPGAIAVIAIAPKGCLLHAPDMYIGRGGAPEGVLAAAGLKCLGGDMQARLCPENEEQEERCHKMGISDVKQILTIDDLVKGDDVMFTASGITNCDLLHGVNFFGNGARTHTISMRYATGTVRFVDAVHTFDRSNINIKL